MIANPNLNENHSHLRQELPDPFNNPTLTQQ